MLSRHAQKLSKDLKLLPYPNEGILCGKIGDFFLSIQELSDLRLAVSLWAKPGDMAPSKELEDYLRMELPDLPRGFSMNRQEYGWVFLLPTARYSKKLETLRSLLSALSSYLTENHMVPCCTHCGKTESLALYQCGEGTACFCETCAVECNNALQTMSVERQKQHSNPFLGFIGAVIGAIPGVILWLLIYRLGYIAAICGLLLAFGAVKGYSMLGKRLDGKGTVISVIVSIGMLGVALILCYGWALLDVFGPEGYSFLDCVLAVPAMLSGYPEVLASFVGEFFMGLLLTGLGSFAAIKNFYRKANPRNVFRKLL